MKKLKYIKPEAEVVHFHLMDGDLYTCLLYTSDAADEL